MSPLPASSRCSRLEAGIAYVAHVAWVHSITHGRLTSAKPWEARQTVTGWALAGAAAQGATGSCRDWGTRLLIKCGARLDHLSADDAIWWRGFAADVDSGQVLLDMEADNIGGVPVDGDAPDDAPPDWSPAKPRSAWRHIQRPDRMAEALACVQTLSDLLRQVKTHSE